jgi:SAM-dependent methyltransferase
MESSAQEITRHYTHGELLAAIERGLQQMGRNLADVTVDDLGPVDEFHTGGRQATIDLLDQMQLRPGYSVLDIGSGIGGTARLLAHRYGCRVTGIDLTPEFVTVAEALTRSVGLEEQVTFHGGDVTGMPFATASFDAATLLHVGMNIADKRAVFAETARVLKPEARVTSATRCRGPGTLRRRWSSHPRATGVRWVKPDLPSSASATAALSLSISSRRCAPASSRAARRRSACICSWVPRHRPRSAISSP